MKKVGIRELKNRLSEYVRLARQGEEVQITHRGEVVAEMRPPRSPLTEDRYPGMEDLVRSGEARAPAKPNLSTHYPRFERMAPDISSQQLLDEERGER